MSHSEEQIRRLANGWCSGNLDANEQLELEEILRESAAARRLFLEYRSLESALRSRAGVRLDDTPVPRKTARDFGPEAIPLLAIAASLVVLLLGLLWLNHQNPNDRTVIVAEVIGSGYWVDHGGTLKPLAANDRISGGAIETTGAASSLKLICQDGTQLEIEGDSAAVLDVDGQKFLRLRKGTLYAEVVPQPAGQPFLIETPTAKFEVLGTRFGLDADNEASRLEVNEGSVRAIRRIDGEAVEVPANHAIVAGFAAGNELSLLPRRKVVFGWMRDLSMGDAQTLGEWLPASAGNPARLRAKSFLFEKGDRSHVVHRISIGVLHEQLEPVRLRSDSEVLVHGTVTRPVELEVMLNTRVDGRFGGNYFYHRQQAQEGPFVIRAPVSDFGGQHETAGAIVPVDADLRRVFVMTVDRDAGLEVSHVEIIASSDR